MISTPISKDGLGTVPATTRCWVQSRQSSLLCSGLASGSAHRLEHREIGLKLSTGSFNNPTSCPYFAFGRALLLRTWPRSIRDLSTHRSNPINSLETTGLERSQSALI